MDLNKEFNSVIEEFAKITQTKINNNLSWTNNLKNEVKITTSSNSLQLNMPEYGIFVDAGRDPGKQPPVNSLYDWMESKSIPIEAAYPIAKSIGENGTEAHPFIYIFEDGIKDLKINLSNLVISNITKGLNKK